MSPLPRDKSTLIQMIHVFNLFIIPVASLPIIIIDIINKFEWIFSLKRCLGDIRAICFHCDVIIEDEGEEKKVYVFDDGMN